MRRYRCRHDIIAAILGKAIEGPSKISHLAQAANLPLDRARPLVEDLVRRGLLIYNPATRSYEATELGYEWLAIYEKLREVYDVL